MASWSRNNSAHYWTWKILQALDLVTESLSFEATGRKKVSGLRHWVQGEARANRNSKVTLLASQFDSIVAKVIRAKYEGLDGSASKAKRREKSRAARKALRSLLNDGGASVAAMGDKVDDLYRFKLEDGE